MMQVFWKETTHTHILSMHRVSVCVWMDTSRCIDLMSDSQHCLKLSELFATRLSINSTWLRCDPKLMRDWMCLSECDGSGKNGLLISLQHYSDGKRECLKRGSFLLPASLRRGTSTTPLGDNPSQFPALKLFRNTGRCRINSSCRWVWVHTNERRWMGTEGGRKTLFWTRSIRKTNTLWTREGKGFLLFHQCLLWGSCPDQYHTNPYLNTLLIRYQDLFKSIYYIMCNAVTKIWQRHRLHVNGSVCVLSDPQWHKNPTSLLLQAASVITGIYVT